MTKKEEEKSTVLGVGISKVGGILSLMLISTGFIVLQGMNSGEQELIIFECVESTDKDEDHEDHEDPEDPEDPEDWGGVPRGMRLTFIHDFNESLVISWYTHLKAMDPKLKYSLYSNLSHSIEITPNFMKSVSSTMIYTAELTNLLPNKTYYYQVSSDHINKREVLNFTTLGSNDNKRVRFLIYSDSQTERAIRRKLVENIMSRFRDEFDFTVSLGDITVDGKRQFLWNNFFDDFEKITAYKQGMYVEGNHEGGLNTKMYDNLFMINNATNRYYYFSHEGMGFIILNSNEYTIDDDIQTEWLHHVLIKSSQENRFTLAFMHHPLLHQRSFDYHKKKWRPLFDMYDVTCIFAGHNHNYQRSYPMLNSTTLEFDDSELHDYADIDNTIYFVSGGAGGPVYPPEDLDFVAKNASTNHFLLVDVKNEPNESTISVEAWIMPDFGALVLADNITITKRRSN